jgi:hypothetical protein
MADSHRDRGKSTMDSGGLWQRLHAHSLSELRIRHVRKIKMAAFVSLNLESSSFHKGASS